ncbi:MAG TPA: hypothetical protein VIV66_03705 [Pyrinomonadaceae bacterium]
MRKLKQFVCVLILLAFATIGVNSQTQPRLRRAANRQVPTTLGRLQQSSTKFRDSLNTTPTRGRSDKPNGESTLSSYERNFQNAVAKFRDRYNRRRATAADVQEILQHAARIDDVVNSKRVGSQVQNYWNAVRTQLDGLASAYGVSWQWNRQAFASGNAGLSSLSDKDLDQLIVRIENGGDAFRSSLTDGFDRTRYDPTRNEGRMNDAVRSFKKATDQLRIQFDNRQLGVNDIQRLIGQASPLESFMRNNKVSERTQSDWSTLRRDLTALAKAYNVDAFWGG